MSDYTYVESGSGNLVPLTSPDSMREHLSAILVPVNEAYAAARGYSVNPTSELNPEQIEFLESVCYMVDDTEGESDEFTPEDKHDYRLTMTQILQAIAVENPKEPSNEIREEAPKEITDEEITACSRATIERIMKLCDGEIEASELTTLVQFFKFAQLTTSRGFSFGKTKIISTLQASRIGTSS